MALPDEAGQRLACRTTDLRVAEVPQGDHPQAGRRVPRHVGPEARVPARMAHERAQVRVGGDEQPEPVAAGEHDRLRVRGMGANFRPERTLDLLHLAPRRAPERVQALGIGAGRERVQEPADPARQVAHRGEHAAHRCERAVRVSSLADQVLATADVAVGQARLRDLLLEIGRGGHAQRHEQAVPHDLAVLGARDVRDDAAQDPVAQVGVVERGPRRPREGRAGGQQLREPVERQSLLAIAPGVVSSPGRPTS